MDIELCGRPIFPRRGALIPEGHCTLPHGHIGACAIGSHDRKAWRTETHELDVDLTEAWKPIRDLPDGELPPGLIGDEL